MRHMIVMFTVFVVGWIPIHILLIVMNYMMVNMIVTRVMSVLAELCLLYDIIDLFLCSHELRGYLKEKLLSRFQN